MGTATANHSVGIGVSAELETVFLPRCAQCKAPHPIVQRSPDPGICPDCGMPAQLPHSARVPAQVAVPGLTGHLLRGALWAAHALRSLARKVAP